jgi:quercetin dioxygenase-like cupin family protein
VSDVLFNIDSNFAYQCGQGRPGYPVTCTGSVTPAAARDALRARAYLALSRATATISGYVTIAVDIHIGRLVMPKSARIALILIAAITANATADEAKPQAVRTILERHDQAGVVGKEILIGTATLPAESVIGYHTHPGDEIGYVLKGTLVLKTRGQPDRILKAGESFFNPRGAVHSLAAAPGGDGGMEVSTWIVDKDKPLVNLVP